GTLTTTATLRRLLGFWSGKVGASRRCEGRALFGEPYRRIAFGKPWGGPGCYLSPPTCATVIGSPVGSSLAFMFSV
ncbi:unnamed protein product, partial [Amoebophrya sp. A25]